MAESSSPTCLEPLIEKPGLGLLVTDTALVDKVLVSGENGGDHVVKGEEELRDEIEREIYRLTLEQAEIEDLERVEKGDVGEEKSVIVVESVGELEKGEVGEEKKSVDVVVSVDRDFGSEIGKGDLGEEDKIVDVVNSVEGDFVSDVEKGDLDEEKNVNVVVSIERDFETELGKTDVDEEEKSVTVVESVEGDFESQVEKAVVGEEKNVSVVESEVGKGDVGEGVEGALESGMVEGERGLPDDDNDGKSVEGENENGTGDDDSVGDQTGEGSGKVARYNQNNNNRRRSNFPMIPDAEDCTYYMKFGTCKFGLNCKFNHPPKRKTQGIKEKVKPSEENTERMGQTECKYHMTQVGCKYGKNCKYYHGSENSSISLNPELNFLGLPIRLGERECPYYMRTGSCKYGSNCRFHHPEPTTVGGGDPGYGNGGSLPSKHGPALTVPSWSSPRAFSESSPYPPVIFPQNHSAAPPNTEWNPSPNPEWNGYQAPVYQTSEWGLPTPPAFAMKNLPTEMNFPLRPLNMMVDEYPERPGEPECSYFMKTGDCKYKSGCKFNHPKNRGPKAKAKASPGPFTLSDKGLPLRPDQPICSHYLQYRICKYGPACRYDHPSNIGGILPSPPFSQPAPFGADKSRKGNKNGIAA